MTKVSVSLAAAPLAGGGQCSQFSLEFCPGARALTADDNHLIRNFPIGSGSGWGRAVPCVRCITFCLSVSFFCRIYFIYVYIVLRAVN